MGNILSEVKSQELRDMETATGQYDRQELHCSPA